MRLFLRFLADVGGMSWKAQRWAIRHPRKAWAYYRAAYAPWTFKR